MSKIFHFSIADRKFSIDVAQNKIESISLYGSYAMGNPNKYSDIDLLIIVADTSKEEHERIRHRILSELDIPDHWLNLFSKSFLQYLCDKADYFTWHIALFSKELYSRTAFTKKTFEHMNPWVDISYELLDNKNYIDKMYQKYKSNRCTSGEIIEAIAGRLRGVAYIACYLYGDIEIDKFEGIYKCYGFKDVFVPFSMKDYRTIYTMKQEHSYSQKDFSFKGLDDYIDKWYSHFCRFYDSVLECSKTIDSYRFKNPLLKHTRRKTNRH